MDFDSSAVAFSNLFSGQLNTENSELKRQILGEYMKNPFLDDNLKSLSIRCGLSSDVLEPILATLREEGLLKSTGMQGHMLDLENHMFADKVTPEVVSLKSDQNLCEIEAKQWSIDALLNASPTAMVFLFGENVFVNASFRQFFGLGDDEPDCKQLIELFGFDPRIEVEKSDKSVSLILQAGIEVQLRKSFSDEREGVLAVLTTDSLSWEVSFTHGQFQEDLFGQLKAKVAEPTEILKTFLSSFEETKLEAARSAVAEIDEFLESYMLSKSNSKYKKEKK
jgi:hypothetical protein